MLEALHRTLHQLRWADACFQLDVALIDGCTLRVTVKQLRVSPV